MLEPWIMGQAYILKGKAKLTNNIESWPSFYGSQTLRQILAFSSCSEELKVQELWNLSHARRVKLSYQRYCLLTDILWSRLCNLCVKFLILRYDKGSSVRFSELPLFCDKVLAGENHILQNSCDNFEAVFYILHKKGKDMWCGYSWEWSHGDSFQGF